jgi:Ni,Fe-hydrogenase III large subunit
VSGAARLERASVDAAAWLAVAADPAAELLALWADTVEAHALWRLPDAALPRAVSVAVEAGAYPALSPLRPAAAWFERMIRDLWGHAARGAVDPRPWLDHGLWEVAAPLSPRPTPRAPGRQDVAFLEVAGDGVQTVPVGPVHAGIIEPGHFRFSVQGETVARMEARLGYTHKGTLLLMRGTPPRAAARFAARLSGDSTVAHAIAFARAAEAATGTDAPPRARSLRAIAAELERVANHLGDIGGIVHDTAFVTLPAAMGALREVVCRAARAGFGHRLMMDAVIPGGMAADLLPGGLAALARALDAIEAELPSLLRLYDGSASVADRTEGAGIIPPARAAAFAAGGVVGRASGRGVDLRVWPGYPPYDALPAADRLEVPVRAAGDVDARVRIRFSELDQSLRLLRLLLERLPGGAVSVPLPMATGEGFGWAEGFRGDIWHWLRLDGGLIGSAFARDPSWLHWPLLEEAMRTTILADFPLLNRSVNASYSGVDL